MANLQTVELPISGMDCAECTQHVQHAIATLNGVDSLNVFLASEKAIVRLDPALVGRDSIRRAVEGASYSIPTGAAHAHRWAARNIESASSVMARRASLRGRGCV